MKPYYADDDAGNGIKADLKQLKKVNALLVKARIEWSKVQFGYIRMNDLAMAQVEIANEIKERERVLAE